MYIPMLLFANFPLHCLLWRRNFKSSPLETHCMYSSRTEGAALIQQAVCNSGIQSQHLDFNLLLAHYFLATCLKSGTGRSSSSLEKNSQTKVSSAVSKSGPYSTGNTFCQIKIKNEIKWKGHLTVTLIIIIDTFVLQNRDTLKKHMFNYISLSMIWALP